MQSRPLIPALSLGALYTCFVTDYGESFNFPGESHEMWELDCILSGNAGITSGTRVYECSEYELVIHPAGIFHTAWAVGGGGITVMTLTFTGDGVEYMVPTGKFILNERERALVEILAGEVGEHFPGDQLPASVANVSPESEQIVKNLLEALCLSLNRRKIEAARTAGGESASRFTEIANYMKDHITEMPDIERICADCGIGRSALKELFRRYTGGGAVKYYNYLRVRHIVKLISRGMSMAQIAGEMHFSSQNYLSAFFKRETGMSPMEYRREKLGDK